MSDNKLENNIGLQDLASNHVIPAVYMSHLLTKKIVFPSLHMKLGLVKQFIKALQTEGDCFKHLTWAFPGLSTKPPLHPRHCD